MMILQGVRHQRPYIGVCYANNPKKRGYTTLTLALDLTTSFRGDLEQAYIAKFQNWAFSRPCGTNHITRQNLTNGWWHGVPVEAFNEFAGRATSEHLVTDILLIALQAYAIPMGQRADFSTMIQEAVRKEAKANRGNWPLATSRRPGHTTPAPCTGQSINQTILWNPLSPQSVALSLHIPPCCHCLLRPYSNSCHIRSGGWWVGRDKKKISFQNLCFC